MTYKRIWSPKPDVKIKEIDRYIDSKTPHRGESPLLCHADTPFQLRVYHILVNINVLLDGSSEVVSQPTYCSEVLH